MSILVDTSVLMEQLETFKENKDKYSFKISYITLNELDHLKENENLNKSFKARKALKFLDTLSDDYFQSDKNTNFKYNDDIIINSAKVYGYDLWTIDYGQKIKARTLGVRIFDIDPINDYKGYRIIKGSTQEINEKFESIAKNLKENEYLIIKNTDTGEDTEMKYQKGRFINLTLPDKKVVHALNANQRCALDLLLDKNIPIKIIIGTYGSGKTMLSVKMGLNLVEKEKYSKLMFVRNPIVSGEEIGFLPGTKQEKTTDFFKPMLQYIDEFKISSLAQRDAIKLEIVSFMKGMSVDDTFMIIDEAEDLNLKLIKLIGTRIGKNSCGVFIGDYKQAEDKYKNDNGLKELIEKTKNNPLVGVIYLDADVRSSASKVFADLE